MNTYTIYCTIEQTKKSFELGAPIELLPNYTEYRVFPLLKCKDGNDRPCIIPTAEQMIGWLEEQGIYIIVPIPLIKDFNKNDFSKADAFEYRIVINGNEPYSGEYLTSKEATLAAIDLALEYLINNKK